MTKVGLISAHSYEPAALVYDLERLLEPLGGIEAFVEPGARVLLKPNLLTGSKPTKECVTRPEVVACVARLVRRAGGVPVLGDSPAFGSARGVAKNNGYLPWLEAEGVEIVEFHGHRHRIEAAEFHHLRLSKEALAADVLINVPKVKSHGQLTLTLGVKNLFGCVPGKMKAWWHLEAGKDLARFADMLVQTAAALAPELTIADGIIGHERNGPCNGVPRPLGVLGASADVFALDRALVEVLGIAPDRVPTIAAARRAGLQPEELEYPLLAPDALAISDWRLADTQVPLDFGVPRILRSTMRHLYIRWIKEPMEAYTRRGA